ncbi:MAG TPA: tol-pal system-associated acyl-CoA thioesterase [Stellaceae bacterium]|nr:tol-pal system-associated acyl-CoA thioesterase [Stellaceae bacterium]
MSEPLPRAGTVIDGVHHFPVRVYYEDTDAGGIVYYANYLKFAERARTELMRGLGVHHESARIETGVIFVVRTLSADYLAPARLDDELIVKTRFLEVRGASLDLDQEVRRDAETLVRLQVCVACIGRNSRPVRVPTALRAALASLND